MQIVIDTAQTRMTVKNSCFYISSPHFKRQIHPRRISSIAILANVTINASAIKLAVDYQVPILFYDTIGRIKARVLSPYFTNLASLRRKQLLVWGSPLSTHLATKHLIVKLKEQEKLLNKMLGKKPKLKSFLDPVLLKIPVVLTNLENECNKTLNEARSIIMGTEGAFAKVYWSAIASCLEEPYQFKKRSRRPAKDLFNASLNYMYGMTYTKIEGAIFAAGLDPFIGYLHTENYRKTALVFDLIEPFRPLVDGLLVELCMGGSLTNKHCDIHNGGCLLNREGKKVVVPAYNLFLESKIEFQSKRRKVRDHIYSYCANFAKSINQFPDDVPYNL